MGQMSKLPAASGVCGAKARTDDDDEDEESAAAAAIRGRENNPTPN